MCMYLICSIVRGIQNLPIQDAVIWNVGVDIKVETSI